jgi:8-oxo-dGTP pyrophosphatase MutT (NUDIX family)
VTRVCVTGGREFDDRAFVYRNLNEFHASEHGPITELGEGEARGVDTLCREWAEERGIPVKPYHADWERYGDAAGCIRNGEMLEDFKPDFLLVFPGNTGTTNCAKQARKLKIERIFFDLGLDRFEELTRWG